MIEFIGVEIIKRKIGFPKTEKQFEIKLGKAVK